MVQQGLIKKIIKAVGLDDSFNIVEIPSLYPPIGKDFHGLPRQKSWHYVSVLGMLNYLCQNTFPDIQFAVHQCAWFTLVPKASHEQAVSCVVCYLIATKNKGYLVTPSS